MSETAPSTGPGRAYWVVAVVALLWNLIGVATYLMSVTMSEDTLAAMPEAERALYTDIPAWVTASYAIAVFGGALASLGLLLRKAWSVPLFLVSLVAILVQMGHALFATALIEVKGAGAAVLPTLIVLFALYFLWFSSSAKKKGIFG